MWESRADRLDREGPDLLYRQVADDLAGMVAAGELTPGSRLPAEPELADVYAVSRATVRSAIMALRTAGTVVVTHGRGTFIAQKKRPPAE